MTYQILLKLSSTRSQNLEKSQEELDREELDQALKGTRDHRVGRDLKELRVFRGFKVSKGFKEFRALREPRGPKGLKVGKEILVQQELDSKAIKAGKVVASRELKAGRDFRVSLAVMEQVVTAE